MSDLVIQEVSTVPQKAVKLSTPHNHKMNSCTSMDKILEQKKFC